MAAALDTLHDLPQADVWMPASLPARACQAEWQLHGWAIAPARQLLVPHFSAEALGVLVEEQGLNALWSVDAWSLERTRLQLQQSPLGVQTVGAGVEAERPAGIGSTKRV